MALLGCDVVMTDQMEVLPLLRRNVERNTSRIKQLNPGSGVDYISFELYFLSNSHQCDLELVLSVFFTKQ